MKLLAIYLAGPKLMKIMALSSPFLIKTLGVSYGSIIKAIYGILLWAGMKQYVRSGKKNEDKCEVYDNGLCLRKMVKNGFYLMCAQVFVFGASARFSS